MSSRYLFIRNRLPIHDLRHSSSSSSISDIWGPLTRIFGNELMKIMKSTPREDEKRAKRDKINTNKLNFLLKNYNKLIIFYSLKFSLLKKSQTLSSNKNSRSHKESVNNWSEHSSKSKNRPFTKPHEEWHHLGIFNHHVHSVSNDYPNCCQNFDSIYAVYRIFIWWNFEKIFQIFTNGKCKKEFLLEIFGEFFWKC